MMITIPMQVSREQYVQLCAELSIPPKTDPECQQFGTNPGEGLIPGSEAQDWKKLTAARARRIRQEIKAGTYIAIKPSPNPERICPQCGSVGRSFSTLDSVCDDCA